jgi:hypothetical protein
VFGLQRCVNHYRTNLRCIWTADTAAAHRMTTFSSKPHMCRRCGDASAMTGLSRESGPPLSNSVTRNGLIAFHTSPALRKALAAPKNTSTAPGAPARSHQIACGKSTVAALHLDQICSGFSAWGTVVSFRVTRSRTFGYPTRHSTTTGNKYPDCSHEVVGVND